MTLATAAVILFADIFMMGDSTMCDYKPGSYPHMLKPNHIDGAITFLFGFSFSQAPHQLNELLLIILFLHKLCRKRSSTAEAL